MYSSKLNVHILSQMKCATGPNVLNKCEYYRAKCTFFNLTVQTNVNIIELNANISSETSIEIATISDEVLKLFEPI